MTSPAAAVVAALVVVGAGAVALSTTPVPPGGPAPAHVSAAAAAAVGAPVALGAAPPAATGPALASRVPPVDGARVRPFEQPAHDYAPGHRGVDLAAGPGQVVVSPADGVVTFAGPVAGRGVVVVAHAGATLTSLEPASTQVAVGERVRRGQPVAVVADTPVHAGCASACLHWGVRVDGRYVDPWWWLGRHGPVRLLPLSDP
jgi:murein DD-endopeptidase MepM/ murein hydrolase activator NlpD